MKRALFIGRFQPLHMGHYEALKKLLRKYGEVVVVIGSTQESFTGENPLTCGERIELIRSCFSKSDIARLVIVPVPDVNDNRIWVDHLLVHIPPVNDVYSNNPLVKMLFSQHGILVKPVKMYDRGSKEGSYLRKLMAEGNRTWTKHVPKNAVKYLDSIEMGKRLKKIVRMGG